MKCKVTVQSEAQIQWSTLDNELPFPFFDAVASKQLIARDFMYFPYKFQLIPFEI